MIAFDLEATGTDPLQDRVIQIGIVRPDGEREWLVHPGREIPEEVVKLTGITQSMVSASPLFCEIAAEVAEALRGGPLVGFGCHRYDVPLLDVEFERSGVAFDWPEVIDAGELFKQFAPRNLNAAVGHYLGRDHVGAHTAVADARAALEVFRQQMAWHMPGESLAQVSVKSRYGRRMADPSGKLQYDDCGRLCFATFRNRGVPIGHDIGYARWMLGVDMPESTKRMIRDELARLSWESQYDGDFAEFEEEAGVF